jgi:predicted ATPase/class 3 adenylate cyclase
MIPTAAPSGTLTFLFSDIEGSTRRWEADAAAMRAVLARHDALMRRQLSDHGGRVFKTVGDGFYCVFDEPADAVAAAAAVQRALHGTDRDDDPVRVRVGIHTGARDDVEQRDGDYFGPPLNRTARLMAAGHGGQVLLSGLTAELAGARLPPGVALDDLGEHRLKDLQRPERIYQLRIDGLPDEHPPIVTLDRGRNNLPTQATPFVGREAEIAQARELLARPQVRLLTFSGPGGIGKTRLSVQVAAEVSDAFPDGVHFAALETIREPAMLLSAIAAAAGVAESAERPTAQVLAEALRGRRLLVLDNFEQVVAGGPLIADLLRACPELKALVTTREALRVYGEHEFRVPTLSIDGGDEVRSDALRLFADRAHAVRHGFAVDDTNRETVAAICRRVDCLPLAIELAAARLRIFTPEALLARLDRALPLLSAGMRDLPGRQQTLRSAIDWSYELLDEADRRLFRQLAVFAGGFTVEAAETVCALDAVALFDGIDSLVGKSLLVSDEDEPDRFGMLQVIHEYAAERLAADGEEPVLRERHAGYYLALAEQGEPEFRGAGQQAWGERFEREQPNFRAALDLLAAGARWEEAWRLAGALYPFWYQRGHRAEAHARLDGLLGASGGAPGADASLARAKVLHGVATLTAGVEPDEARRLFEESLAIRRRAGDERGIVSSLNNLGNLVRYGGDYATAERLYEEARAISRQLKDEWAESVLSINVGVLAQVRGDYAVARERFEQGLTITRRRGDQYMTATALAGLGAVAAAIGEDDEAQRWLEEGLTVYRQTGNRQGSAEVLNALGDLAAHRGDFRTARGLYDEALALGREVGHQRRVGAVLRSLAMLAIDQGDVGAARAWLHEAVETLLALGERRYLASALEALAGLHAIDEQPEQALALAAAAAALRRGIGAPCPPSEQARLERWLSVAQEGLAAEEQAAAAELGGLMNVEDALREFLR